MDGTATLSTMHESAKRVEFIAIEGLPEVQPGDDLAGLIAVAAREQGLSFQPGDVVVVTSKVISKAEDWVFDPAVIQPTAAALSLSRLTGRSAGEVELILRESRDLLFAIPYRLILPILFGGTEGFARRFGGSVDQARALFAHKGSLFLTLMPTGYLASDAGLDGSNVPHGAAMLPPDPYASVRALRDALQERTGLPLAVIVTDTEVRLLSPGTVDVAVGMAGILPFLGDFARKDRHGRSKFGGLDHVADEIAAGAALVMGQTDESVPVVICRGARYRRGDPLPAPPPSGPGVVLALAYLIFNWVRLRVVTALR